MGQILSRTGSISTKKDFKGQQNITELEKSQKMTAET